MCPIICQKLRKKFEITLVALSPPVSPVYLLLTSHIKQLLHEDIMWYITLIIMSCQPWMSAHQHAHQHGM